MRVETVSISKLKLNPDNPRSITQDKFRKLVKSLRDFPAMKEIRELVVDENYVVLGGNMRLRALKEIGEKKATVKIAEGLSDEQKREFIIKDNASFGEWDFDVLANTWSIHPLKDWGVDLPNFDMELIDNSGEEDTRGKRVGEVGTSSNMVVSIGLLNEIIPRDKVERLGDLIKDRWSEDPVANFVEWAIENLPLC
jgi:hypothetical protein